MKFRVLITDPVDSFLIESLEEKNIAVTYEPEATSDQVKKLIGEYDAIVVRSRTKLDSDVLRETGKLKLVARAGIGLDSIDTELLRERNIEVRYAPGESTESVAELALGLMISGSRDFVRLSSETKKGIFRKKVGMELSGRTLGIIGFGRIGYRVAQLASALGMNILAYDVLKNQGLIASVHGKYCPLEDLLKNSDIVSLFVTVRKGDSAILGASELSLLKDGSILVNTSRASAVDGPALLSHLKSGKISFYGADVLWNEPPREEWEHELISQDNVVITPHIGAQTVESQRRIAGRTAREISEYMEGLE